MLNPDNVIRNLLIKVALSAAQQQQIRNILAGANVLDAINAGILQAEDLLSPTAPPTVLVASKIPQLILACEIGLKTNSVREKRIPLLFWLRDSSSFYPFILSPANLSSLGDFPTLEIVPNFREYLELNIEAAKKWDNIREELNEIGKLAPSRFKEKKIRAEDVCKQLEQLRDFIGAHRILREEYFDISTATNQYINANPEPLQTAATQYFNALFLEENKELIKEPAFFRKGEGVQLGRKMVIDYIDKSTRTPHTIAYFIKTHQYGSTSHTSSAKTVDPKELFIYKAIAYMGAGAKVHFFFNPLSHGGFYIATQDASFTKQADRVKSFETYDRLKDSLNLQDIYSVRQETKVALAKLDILARIFRLHDITTNSGNFGRVTVDGIREKWKIVDFRIDTFSSYLYDNIFAGFISGNGTYNYDGLLGALLRERPEAERLYTAKSVIQELDQGLKTSIPDRHKISLIPAIDRAAVEIREYVDRNNNFLRIEPSSIADFERYVESVKINYSQLKRDILARAPERITQISLV